MTNDGDENDDSVNNSRDVDARVARMTVPDVPVFVAVAIDQVGTKGKVLGWYAIAQREFIDSAPAPKRSV